MTEKKLCLLSDYAHWSLKKTRIVYKKRIFPNSVGDLLSVPKMERGLSDTVPDLTLCTSCAKTAYRRLNGERMLPSPGGSLVGYEKALPAINLFCLPFERLFCFTHYRCTVDIAINVQTMSSHFPTTHLISIRFLSPF